jgi:hypothetical protein
MTKKINLKTRRLSKKLDNKLYRPFQVEKEIILTVIRVTLLSLRRIHNVFDINYLESYFAIKWQGAMDST